MRKCKCPGCGKYYSIDKLFAILDGKSIKDENFRCKSCLKKEGEIKL